MAGSYAVAQVRCRMGIQSRDGDAAQVVAGFNEGSAEREALEALMEHQRRRQRPDGAGAVRHAQRDAYQNTARSPHTRQSLSHGAQQQVGSK